MEKPQICMSKQAVEMIEKYRELPLSVFRCAEHNRYYVEFDRLFPYNMERCYCSICLENQRKSDGK